ncbi:helix-turn-helix transcriptional regulator [Paenibacillus sp.]|uniref:helix-turn-helix transcriptional regulator n=1 Tax=Paenibacillus sp. TaxID=58172 RepID=UPI002D63F0C9|nr:WYL domain-containing protein [Paenibacillus sp.]HZG55620.1 WYL domain-containing protein [Paenibacillus sp.]
MKADRLISILFALQQGATLTVRELADRLEVSPRTVTRDLEALAASGVPVYAERGYGGGWKLAEGFRARFNGLKRDDLERLLLARSTSAKLFADLGREKEFGETWDKLLQAATAGGNVDAAAVRERIHIDGAGWRESFETLPWLPPLYDAVWDCRKLTIRYARDEADRELLPLGLVAKGNAWYVVGSTGGNLRTYRVSRITALTETDETFGRPAGFDLESYWQTSMASFRERLPTYTVRLRLDGAAYERLRDMRFTNVLEARTTESPKDGEASKYEVEADLQTEAYAVECLLRLGGEGVELLDPAELIVSVREAVRRLAEAYGA